MDRTCPNSLHLFPASVRQPLRNMVEDVCPRRNFKRRLSASQFQANNIDRSTVYRRSSTIAEECGADEIYLVRKNKNITIQKKWKIFVE